MLYLQGSGANATKLGECRSWRIDIDRETDEDNAMGDTWKTAITGFLSWSVSIEGNLDTAETSPFDAATATATKKIYLYPVASSTTAYYYGTIWPKLSVEVGIGGVARFTLDGDGDADLAKN